MKKHHQQATENIEPQSQKRKEKENIEPQWAFSLFLKAAKATLGR
jgi:hypothetical protein